MHSTPLQPILQDIRIIVDIFAILDTETLRKELEKREAQMLRWPVVCGVREWVEVF